LYTVIDQLAGGGVSVWLDEPGNLVHTQAGEGGLSEGGLSLHGLSGFSLGPLTLRQALPGQPGFVKPGSPAGPGPEAQEFMASYAQQMADLVRPVYDKTNGADGHVSIGLPLGAAPGCAAIVSAAKDTWASTARPNIRVKTPATEAGLTAATELIGAGISVDITLVYSAYRLQAAMAAIAAGLAQAVERGHDLSLIGAAVSVSVCEMDTEVDKLLWSIASDVAGRLRGTAALANAYLTYEAYETCLSASRWRSLVGLGARVPQLTWTSVQVRDPYYAEAKYVQGLAIPGVAVNLNERTLDALAGESVTVGDSLREFYENGHLALAALAEIGIDSDDVASQLESRGAQALATAWDQAGAL
jgi:transaldolase